MTWAELIKQLQNHPERLNDTVTFLNDDDEFIPVKNLDVTEDGCGCAICEAADGVLDYGHLVLNNVYINGDKP